MPVTKADVTQVKAAIDNAHKALNAVIDGQWKARQHQALRTLTLAANALKLAETHLDKAVAQTTPKPAAETAAK